MPPSFALGPTLVESPRHLSLVRDRQPELGERFSLMRRLGAGGFGVVFAARDHRRGELVALKLLDRCDAEALFRFKREFRALADLYHPNLVGLYELFADDRLWFFTMELVDGVPFTDFVTRRHVSKLALARTEADSEEGDDETLPPWDVESPPSNICAPRARLAPPADLKRLRIALSELTCGVSALHASGRVHRDIKPSNVLVTGEGRAVLLDFGLITAQRGGVSLEPVGACPSLLAGTPMYMAPEAAMQGELTPAADWYAVGVMLYEALAGRAPFGGRSPLEVLLRKQTDVPPPPSEFRSDVPRELEALCLGLLSRDPSARPTAGHILDALDAGCAAEDERGAFVVPRRMPTAPVAIGGARAVRLHGRDDERASLLEAFDEARAGKAMLVEVAGASGIGKSALVRSVAQEISARGGLTLRGRCFDRESVPFRAVDGIVDSLCEYLRGLSQRQLSRLLPRDAGLLPLLFPVLERVEGFFASPALQEPPLSLRRRALIALRQLFTRLCARVPIALLIDDAQWGDHDSAVLVAALLRGPEPPPLMVVLCVRPEARAGSPLLQQLDVETLDVARRSISLAPLDSAASCALALELVGASRAREQLAIAIARESRGNPFFIGALAQHAGTEEQSGAGRASAAGARFALAGVSFERALERQISEQPAGARRLLEMLAIAGGPLDERLVGDLFDGVAGLLRALVAARLLRRRLDQVECYHDRIRETLAAQLDGPTRARLHGELAEGMLAGAASDPEALTFHLARSGQPRRALEYALEAAGIATRAMSFGRAVELHRWALELDASAGGERDEELSFELASALLRAGRGVEAAELYLDVAERCTDADQAFDWRRRGGQQLLHTGHIDRGLGVLQDAVDKLDLPLAATSRAAQRGWVWRRLKLAVRGLSSTHRDAAEHAPTTLRRIDCAWSLATGLGLADHLRAAHLHAVMLDLALRAGEPLRLSRALALEATFSATRGYRRRERTAKLLQRATKLAALADEPTGLMLSVHQRMVAYLEGRHCDVVKIELDESCLGRLVEPALHGLTAARLIYLRALFVVGRLPELKRELFARLAEADGRGDAFELIGLRLLSHFGHLVEDRPDDARRVIASAMADLPRTPARMAHYWEVGTIAMTELYAGNPQRALDALGPQWHELRRAHILRIEQYRLSMMLLISRSRLALTARRAQGEASERERRRVLSDLRKIERHGAPWATTLATLLRATVASQRGDRERARALLLEAMTQLGQQQAHVYLEVARYRLGELTGGDAGAQQRERAVRWMRERGVRSPARWADMVAPGFLTPS